MTNITPNYLDNDGFTVKGEEFETEINLVWTKGTRKKAIGKTGYMSQKVLSVSSNAPTYYKLISYATGKTIDHFLSMASLKESMARRGFTAIKAKKETLEQAHERGYAEGFKRGYSAAIEQGAIKNLN